ncbi:MAG: CvpA family protein [Clostridia bacterium]|nr:CvpA family protein [Clostridia bacterium]
MADIIFCLVGIAIILISAKRGFVRSLLSFGKGFLAIVASYLFGNMLGPWIGEMIPAISGVIANFLSYLLVFVIVYVGLILLSWVLGALIDRLMIIGKIDMILGGVIGLVLAVMVLFIAASLLKFLPWTRELYAESTVIRFFGDSSFLKAIKIFDFGNAWFN